MGRYLPEQIWQALAPHSCELPPHAQELYRRICQANDGKKSGWFDVFAWKEGRYLFVESKQKSKDSIRETQKSWIQVALNVGVPLDSLLICEWELGYWHTTSDALSVEDVEEIKAGRQKTSGRNEARRQMIETNGRREPKPTLDSSRLFHVDQTLRLASN